MVNKDLLATKLAELASRKNRVRAHIPKTAAELAANLDALDIVSFNLMLCIQICADIASHLVADEGWAAAASLAQGFARLEEHGVLTSATAEALKRAVGLRNVIAHGYSRLEVDFAFSAATTGLDDIDAFAREVTSWSGRQS